MVFSGLQLDVFKLYRNLLRAGYKHQKSHQVLENRLIKVIKKKFREDARSIDKHDFNRIEYAIRRGYKQVKLIQMPGFAMAHAVNLNH